MKYSARLTKGSTNSWAVEFRHPILRDRRDANLGRKIRRGLGINEEEAKIIVEELNTILQDETYWSVTEIRRAKELYNQKTINIFYDQMEEDTSHNPWNIREEYHKLPEKEYTKVMLLGTTGAGKTTILRQLIGTDPNEVSFPAISSSRTTICDTEIIFSDSTTTNCIVTFLSQAQTIRLIEECVIEAFKRAVSGDDDKKIAKALLTHPEQRFRLSYILGQYNSTIKQSKIVESESLDFPYPDKSQLFDDMIYIIDKVKFLATEAIDACPPADDDIDKVIELLYEDWIREDTDTFHDLVSHILSLIKFRFNLMHNTGKMIRDTRGWPIYWTHDSNNKNEILHLMRFFAGNDGNRFGQLLAPVVNGLRIIGPFRPHWWKNDTVPKLVLVDGEGVGHDSSITTSLPIDVAEKFNKIDVILLVDNSVQPMLDIPKVIIHDTTFRGHQDKLIVTYTRFEDVNGPNLLDEEDRRDHVLSIQNSAIDSLLDTHNMNPKVVRQLKDSLSEKAIFLSNTNDLKNPPNELIEEMQKLIKTCLAVAKPHIPKGLIPIPSYEYDRLILVISETTSIFMQKWLSLLGIKTSQFPKQHWSRIKALTNRFANWPGVTRYDDLKPADDLASYLIQRLNIFLSSPKEWRNNPLPSEDEKQLMINKVMGHVSSKINNLVIERLKIDHHAQWLTAYAFKRDGSTTQRASQIRNIFEQTIPEPTIRYDVTTDDLLQEIKVIIEESIINAKNDSEDLIALED
ncbi:hypothetical protein NLX71_25725 [Paenibacillus sp. MZ04-78.2]|uniref:hypothetical protein n=1 Tax=Paenibacillus sp. MZ04-78.2 TaxID=2962034 RepID=UPI0020B8C0A5|nr:hypothetical protein [Paenibacillus sp. MZ04-78.2]MCP3776645.1 hypothetical protein [Paenibacillus sp. MZ04-78.2]